ncbi:hypothetical protein CAPTEDRAFT_172979 [Capitella teleta]|uniref:DNA primase n=1 Tax=Capitella teleta TaxID=283909 RepID=R7THB3_CAPTE|nr:hypothetical protein CAPTEDRAFT_172979 [Capitella teleta]|eukprot:ELT90971.1 hypothetical protein CAPTEDRAFT_172979 [Capitella teleta]
MCDKKSSYDPASLPDFLPMYYKRFFPYGAYFKWLNYGGVPKNYFSHREFSFTLKDDVYLRYQSFSDKQELEKEIQKRCPYKIDIGAVFSHRPRDQKAVKAADFRAMEKELVFDIDMTDYDDVRFCCSGADICSKCWPLMTIAIKVIHRSLCDDFGFEHILWVYSGRRGVHCWVCDEVARKMSQTARSAVAEYLSVVKGGENQAKKVNLYTGNIHPSITAALDIIGGKSFKSYAIEKQDFAGTDEQIQKILSFVPDENFRDGIMNVYEKNHPKTSYTFWNVFKEYIKEKADFTHKKLSNLPDELMLQYCYPRLDVNVSKGVNHLLKSPFCVHPKTGRVCVPIDHEKAEEFDPFTVPTISQLCDELATNDDSDNSSKRRVKDYRQTSLGRYMHVFDNFLKKLEKTWHGKIVEENGKDKQF